MSGAPVRTAQVPVARFVPRLLSVREVAQSLGLSRSRVYEMISTGELEAYRPGGRIRVAADAVVELLERTKL